MDTLDLTALLDRYQAGLRSATDDVLAYEATRAATLRGEAGAQVRHLVDEELEYRLALRHLAEVA